MSDDQVIRRARSIQPMACADPKCTMIHLTLFDENDVPFAEAPIEARRVSDFTTELLNAAGRLLHMKGL